MSASAGIFKPKPRNIDHKIDHKQEEQAVNTTTVYYPAIYSVQNTPNFNDFNILNDLNKLFAEEKGVPATLMCAQDAEGIMGFFSNKKPLTQHAVITLEVPDELLNPKPPYPPKARISIQFKQLKPDYIVSVITNGKIYNKKVLSTKHPIGGPAL